MNFHGGYGALNQMFFVKNTRSDSLKNILKSFQIENPLILKRGVFKIGKTNLR